MDNNGWAGRPGVPLNPEKRQWHWVCGHSPAEKPRPELWSRNMAGFFWWSTMLWREDTAARHWRYLRPCLPDDLSPGEVEARIATARKGALEETESRVADALKWRNAINDYLTQEWHNPLKDDESPYAALKRILKCEFMEMALDPIRIKAIQAEIAQAKRDALEEAAQRLEALHRQHKYKPKTGEGSEHDAGYYRALSEGAAWIRALIDAPSEVIIRADRDAWPDYQANDPVRALKGEGHD